MQVTITIKAITYYCIMLLHTGKVGSGKQDKTAEFFGSI
jgi:hypothetical protein